MRNQECLEGDIMKGRLSQYKHYLLLLYFPVYLAAFRWLETVTPDKIHIIECSLDKYIPFMEIFIVPYLLWFAYIGGAGIYLLFRDKESFCRMMYFGMIGMTLFVVVSWLYPNGLELRPETFARDNVFVTLTKFVYSMDTSTNVLPSIHVYNSIGVCAALWHSEKLKDKKWLQISSSVLMVLIILSTMFVKQHSMIDVMSASILAWSSYELIYNERWADFRDALQGARYRKKTVPGLFGK